MGLLCPYMPNETFLYGAAHLICSLVLFSGAPSGDKSEVLIEYIRIYHLCEG